MSGISQIANTMAAGQRGDVEKDSATARKDHAINVMPPRFATQGVVAAETLVRQAYSTTLISTDCSFGVGLGFVPAPL